MRCNVDVVDRAVWVVAACVAIGVAFFGCSKSTTSPSQDGGNRAQASLLGRWNGTITAPGIADGTIAVDLTTEASVPLPSARGTHEISFPDSTFNASGRVTVESEPATRKLVFVFDPAIVPCPGAPGGIKQETRIAVLTLTGSHAAGTYVTSSCPFGTLTLVRQ